MCPSSVQAEQNRGHDRFKSAIRLTEKNWRRDRSSTCWPLQ